MRRTATHETVTYREFSRQERRHGKCPVCQKRRTRSTTFAQTMSPFNVDPETGQPRTASQIEAALAEKCRAWNPDFSCSTHPRAEVCAVVGHTPSKFSPGRCVSCRAEIPGGAR